MVNIYRMYVKKLQFKIKRYIPKIIMWIYVTMQTLDNLGSDDANNISKALSIRPGTDQQILSSFQATKNQIPGLLRRTEVKQFSLKWRKRSRTSMYLG